MLYRSLAAVALTSFFHLKYCMKKEYLVNVSESVPILYKELGIKFKKELLLP